MNRQFVFRSLLVLLTIGFVIYVISKLVLSLAISTYDISPSWSPDGQYITFVCYMPTIQDVVERRHDGELLYPPESSEICIMSSDGSNRKQLTYNRASDFDPIWSPDNSQIAFISNREGSYALYLMDPDGSQQRRVSHLGSISHLAWARIGKNIAYSYNDGNGIYVLDLLSGKEKQVVKGRTDFPSWFPSGKLMAFVTHNQRPNECEIHIITVETGIEVIRPIISQCRAPVWAPDDVHVAFVNPATEAKKSVLFVLDLYEPTPRPLTDGDKSIEDGIVWSPNGEYVLYIVEGELASTSIITGETVRITNLGGSLVTLYNKQNLTIDPLGKEIAFSRSEAGSTLTGPLRIWKTATDGSRLTRLSP